MTTSNGRKRADRENLVRTNRSRCCVLVMVALCTGIVVGTLLSPQQSLLIRRMKVPSPSIRHYAGNASAHFSPTVTLKKVITVKPPPLGAVTPSGTKARTGSVAKEVKIKVNRTLTKKIVEEIKLTTRTPPASAPPRARLTVWFNGRLGNRMFEVASMYGVARANNLTPFIRATDDLVKYFEIGKHVVLDTKPTDYKKLKKFAESVASGYDKRAEHLDLQSGEGELQGYRQSWRYFSKYEGEVREMFTLKPDLRQQAETVLRKVAKTHPGTITFVAIHSRRGDMVNNAHGYLVADEKYFTKAMRYFREKYPHVVFVVCSDDIKWTKNSVKAVNNDVAFMEGHHYSLDMAIMSLCNHTIMSVGSFGWWAAWLANGETIYYETPAREASKLIKEYIMSDYYPSRWKPML